MKDLIHEQDQMTLPSGGWPGVGGGEGGIWIANWINFIWYHTLVQYMPELHVRKGIVREPRAISSEYWLQKVWVAECIEDSLSVLIEGRAFWGISVGALGSGSCYSTSIP